jgi:DNA-binding response OmpR family regulator
MTVVIIDSDHAFREALAIAARIEGHQVATAASAPEAETVLALTGDCLMVVDCLVGGADGLLARRRGPALVAGHRRELAERLAERHGLRALEKPFGLEELGLAGSAPPRSP